MLSWDWESGWGGTVVRYERSFCVVRTCFSLCFRLFVAKKQDLKLPCDLCAGKLWNESPSQISFKIRTSFLKYCFQLCWYKFLMSLKCLNKTKFPGNGLVILDFLFFFRLWQLKCPCSWVHLELFWGFWVDSIMEWVRANHLQVLEIITVVLFDRIDILYIFGDE